MIERFVMHFEPGMDERVISVCLPQGYARSEERYPVMYMFDGQNVFEQVRTAYGKSWNLHAFMALWEKRMIVVAVESSIENGRHLTEYCPYPLAPHAWDGLRSRGRDTMAWMADVLKPHIDQTYRTLADRRCTGVAGASMGALMSLYAVTAYNDVFSKAACVSAAFDVCDGRLLEEVAGCGVSPDTRVYLSMGEHEARDQSMLAHMTAQQLAVANALMAQGARVYPYLQLGGRHCEADWRAQTEGFMRFLWLERV